MKRQNDLGGDPVPALVLRLTLPAMMAQLVNVLYGIIDRMFIGHIPVVGDLALAGVGVCSPIVTFVSSFGTLVGIGGSIMMATSMGQGNMERAKKILSNSFLLLLIFSGLLTLGLLLSKDELILLFGGSPQSFEYADTYLTIYVTGTFFALLALGLNYFISSQGFSLNAMITVIIGAVSNIILDALFVPGLKMGVAGAAIATVISQMLSCAYALVFLLGRRIPVKICFKNYDIRTMLKIIGMGISPFIIISTDSLIIIAMNVVLQKYGGESGDLLISAYTVAQSYFLLVTGPLIGISGGVQPIISFNYGAVREERVKKTVKCALLMGVIFTAAMFAVSRLFARDFAAFFTGSSATAETAARGIKIFTLAVVPLAFQYVLVDALTALGQIKTALYLSASRKLCFLGLMILFAVFYKAEAAFYAEPAADVLGAVQSTIVFILVFRGRIKKYFAKAQSPCRAAAAA